MSKEKDNLFELIQSMTKSEKRYFKLYSSLHVKGDANNYNKLFDVIEKQKEYNEEEIKGAFKPDDPILKQYIYNRFYLQKLILKSLVAYHKKSGITAQINEEIEMAQILMKKELYKASLKVFNNVEKLSEKYTLSLKQLEIRLIKRRLLSHLGFKNTDNKAIKKYYSKNKLLLEYINTTIELDYIDSKIILDINKEQKGKNIKYKEIEQELLKYTSKPHNTDNAYQLYGNLAVLKYAQKEINQSYSFLKKCLLILQQDKFLIEKNPHKYIAIMNNLFIISMELKKYSETMEYLNKIELFAEKYKKRLTAFDMNKIMIRTFSGKLTLYNLIGNFKKSVELIEDPKMNSIIKNKLQDMHWFDINISCFYTYFGVGNYNHALSYLQSIISVSSKNDLKKDIQASARLLEIITHYELENTLILEHLILSTTRFLKKIKKYTPAVQLIIKAFNQLYKTKDFQKIKKIISELKKGLIKQNNLPFINHFDIYSWIDSKMENKSFYLKVKENIK